MAPKARTQQHKSDSPAGDFAKVAAAVEIQDVRFLSFEASFIPEAIENQGLAVGFGVQTRTCADGDNNRIFVVADFVMEASPEANKGEKQKIVSACIEFAWSTRRLVQRTSIKNLSTNSGKSTASTMHGPIGENSCKVPLGEWSCPH